MSLPRGRPVEVNYVFGISNDCIMTFQAIKLAWWLLGNDADPAPFSLHNRRNARSKHLVKDRIEILPKLCCGENLHGT